MAQIDDQALHGLLATDVEAGWRTFVQCYTPVLLQHIQRAGITSRDETMDVYVRVCERLAEDDCARLRHYDPERGELRSWLAVVVRHVTVDWIRSRRGRRRVFRSVARLSAFDRRVFELFYWEGFSAAEMAEILATNEGRDVELVEVLAALERVETELTLRQRAELLSLAGRGLRPVPLEDEAGNLRLDPPAPDPDPEALAGAGQLEARLGGALADLPAEDAAIVRLRYVQGLGRAAVQRALRLDELTEKRLIGILDGLRRRLLSPAERRSSGTERVMPGSGGSQ